MADRIPLDAALHSLADEIAWPPAGDLRPLADVPATARRGWPWRRAIVVALAATFLIAAAVVAASFLLPGFRMTIVPSVPTPPPEALGGRIALGDRVDVSDVPDLVFPEQLGAPDEVYVAHDGEVVTLLYAASGDLPALVDDREVGLLVQEIRGDMDTARVEKLRSEVGATVTPVRVGDADGFWIEGPPHLVRYFGIDGRERAEMTRLVGTTLVWQRDDSLFRIESALGMVPTIGIAESIGP